MNLIRDPFICFLIFILEELCATYLIWVGILHEIEKVKMMPRLCRDLLKLCVIVLESLSVELACSFF
jgi:hypothetical protein